MDASDKVVFYARWRSPQRPLLPNRHYKLRDGTKVFIVQTEGNHKFPVVDDQGCRWHWFGCYYNNIAQPHERDIVDYWED